MWWYERGNAYPSHLWLTGYKVWPTCQGHFAAYTHSVNSPRASLSTFLKAIIERSILGSEGVCPLMLNCRGLWSASKASWTWTWWSEFRVLLSALVMMRSRIWPALCVVYVTNCCSSSADKIILFLSRCCAEVPPGSKSSAIYSYLRWQCGKWPFCKCNRSKDSVHI